MKQSGIWEGKPFADPNLAKKYKKDFAQFQQEMSYLVKEDKVAVATQSAHSARLIAAIDLREIAATQQHHISEQLLPQSHDLGMETKEGVKAAQKV